MIKYYKEIKVGEEKTLRIDLDTRQVHPQKPEAEVYETIFLKLALNPVGKEGLLVPIVAPGLVPVTAVDPENTFGFTLTEISYEEFKHYANKLVDQLGMILAKDELQQGFEKL